VLITLAVLVSPATPAFAAPSEINAANTAWMMVATALVLMMTIPGLALFYSGMVRKKNVLATMAQSLAAVAIISVLWVAFGYSLSFVGDGPWLGNLDRVFLAGMTMESVNPAAKTIPEALFMLYQMTFAIITVALTASPRAVMAIIATHLAASSGALVWGGIEWWSRKKPSVLGMISGAVAGLGTVTPASGFVAPWHGIIMGAVAGGVCYWACTWLKHRFNYDDSLDVFGVHGIGGLTGTLLCGMFANRLDRRNGRPARGSSQAGPDPAQRHRRHPGLVGRRDLRPAQAGRHLRAPPGLQGGDGRPRYHATWRGPAVSAHQNTVPLRSQ
jgi:ammonia channel protein AmtB